MGKITYKLFGLYDKYLSKDYYYLILMTLYHLEILFFAAIGIEVSSHTFLPMISSSHASSLSILNYQFSFSSFNAIFFTIVILIVDFAFLFIIKKEIKHYEQTRQARFPFQLTTMKVIIIEIIVLLLSVGHPTLRAALYFMSFNTIQIYIIYRVIFRLKIFNPVIILGVYIAIIELILYPIWTILRLWWIYGGN
jgi:hypothetical protein